ASASSSSAAVRVATIQRQAKSVTRIHQLRAIPEGAPITLDLAGHIRPEVVKAVDEWLDADPMRRNVTWVDHPDKPLRWAADPTKSSWSPSGLRNRIFIDAGLSSPNFSAADAWKFNGRSLYQVANDA